MSVFILGDLIEESPLLSCWGARGRTSVTAVIWTVADEVSYLSTPVASIVVVTIVSFTSFSLSAPRALSSFLPLGSRHVAQQSRKLTKASRKYLTISLSHTHATFEIVALHD